MRYYIQKSDTSVKFTDRWEDSVTFELDEDGVLVQLAGNQVRLEKDQIVFLIKDLVEHLTK